jgi:predicted type IV restriction endonuclease
VIDPPINEATVREEIIAPLLSALGYRANGENDIRRELPLRYPRRSLGHKKPKKDPPLIGKADYVCYAGGRVVWTIEAKPSGAAITADDVEQAFLCHSCRVARGVFLPLQWG